MEEHQTQPPHALPPHHPTSQNPVVMAVVLSVLFGALAGGIVGYLFVGTNVGKSITDAVSTKTVSVQEESATVDVVKKTDPAVVSIVASKDYSKIYGNNQANPFYNFFFGGQQPATPQGSTQVSSGSGFMVRANGLIVTNRHVVEDTTADYTVVMNDGKTYKAQVLARDTVNDVALVKVDGSNFPILTLGDSDKVQIGQTVIAIGNALGQYRNTVTKGVISGEARTVTASDGAGNSETLEDVLQTDASINPGNSGGPLLDLDGSVIGMNTAIDQQGTLIGFAIPINAVKQDIDSVDKTGKIVTPYIGVRYIMLSEAVATKNNLPVKNGAWIQADTTTNTPGVVSGGPADKAGLVVGDIITKINGVSLDETHSLVGQMTKYKPGDVVTLEMYHDGKAKTVKVTLAERSAN